MVIKYNVGRFDFDFKLSLQVKTTIEILYYSVLDLLYKNSYVIKMLIKYFIQIISNNL